MSKLLLCDMLLLFLVHEKYGHVSGCSFWMFLALFAEHINNLLMTHCSAFVNFLTRVHADAIANALEDVE